jgi:proline iminopeptidase
VSETVLTDDGVRLWAERTGEGEPVVFCHGGPGLWDTLGEVAEPLVAGGGVAVCRWDQRGCGRSQRSGPFSMERSVADLDAVRRHFGLERMALLGHSWGAQLALSYALAHPGRVSGLVYVAGTGIDPDAPWHAAYERGLRRGIGDERLGRWEELRELRSRRGRLSAAEEREFAVLQWSADFAGPDRERALEHARRMATPWFGINFACNAAIGAETKRTWGTPELRAACEGLDVPTLIVDGAEDIRPRWAVDSLERALPRVWRTSLEGAGHLPWTEAPEGFRAAVAAFLRDCGYGTSRL